SGGSPPSHAAPSEPAAAPRSSVSESPTAAATSRPAGIPAARSAESAVGQEHSVRDSSGSSRATPSRAPVRQSTPPPRGREEHVIPDFRRESPDPSPSTAPREQPSIASDRPASPSSRTAAEPPHPIRPPPPPTPRPELGGRSRSDSAGRHLDLPRHPYVRPPNRRPSAGRRRSPAQSGRIPSDIRTPARLRRK